MRLASSTVEAGPITVSVLGPFLARMVTLHPVAVRMRSVCEMLKVCFSLIKWGSTFNLCCSVTSWSVAGSTAMAELTAATVLCCCLDTMDPNDNMDRVRHDCAAHE